MTTTNLHPQPRIYPGLLDGAIEFFNDADGRFNVMSGGKVKEFRRAPYSYHQILKEAIAKEPETFEILNKWYPHSELQRLTQFGSCRFGGLDYEGDVNGYELQEGEYSECAARGMCPGEGILCKAPRYKGVALTFIEIKIIKALATTSTNEAIAHTLALALGTFHLLKKNLYHKLNIQTKQEAVMIGRDLNLI